MSLFIVLKGYLPLANLGELLESYSLCLLVLTVWELNPNPKRRWIAIIKLPTQSHSRYDAYLYPCTLHTVQELVQENKISGPMLSGDKRSGWYCD